MSTPDDRVWEWTVAIGAMLSRSPGAVSGADDDLIVAVATFLSTQADLLDYPKRSLTERDLLLVTRAFAQGQRFR